MATADLGLVIGSKWYVGNKVTGTSVTPEVFDTDIEYALVQDLYLNTTTSNVYQCALEGDDTTAKWQYVCNIKGLQPPVVNSLNSTSTTDALSANMGNVLFEKLLNSGVFTQDIIVDISDTIYSVALEVENKDSTITFTSEDDTATYSVTKSGTSETQTLNLTIESLFTDSGVVIKEISSTENIYSVTLNGIGGTEVFSVEPSVWTKLNELDQQIKIGGNITDGEETLKEGVISRLINGVKTALYPITHAKAVWFDKSNNKTVYDELDGLGTASTKDVPVSGNASNSQVVMGNDTRLSNSRPASDVSAWAKSSTKPSYTASEVGAAPTNHRSSETTYGVATSALYGHVKVDTALNASSTNPVRNSVIKTALDDKVGKYASAGNFWGANTLSVGSGLNSGLATSSGGNITWSASQYSDERIKINIENSKVDALDIINKLEAKEFDYIDKKFGKHTDLGFIAQNIEEYIPEAILECPQTIEGEDIFIKTLAYEKIVPYLIKAVQEQQEQIDELRNQINQIKEAK